MNGQIIKVLFFRYFLIYIFNVYCYINIMKNKNCILSKDLVDDNALQKDTNDEYQKMLHNIILTYALSHSHIPKGITSMNIQCKLCKKELNEYELDNCYIRDYDMNEHMFCKECYLDIMNQAINNIKK